LRKHSFVLEDLACMFLFCSLYSVGIITLTKQAPACSCGPAPQAGAGAPAIEITCVRVGRLRPVAEGLEVANDPFDAARQVGERLGDWFPDNWLYNEDDATLEFKVKRVEPLIGWDA
jgi:hypothetical protein